MNEGRRKVKAYLQDSGYTEPVRFSQYDEILEGLSVEVYENVTANNPLSLTDFTVRLEGTKPDKKGYSYDGTVMGTYATFDVKQNMTAVPGEYDAEVVLIKTTNGKKERAGTAGIHFRIEAVGVRQDADLSSSELAPYINAAKENAEIAEQALDGAISTLKRVQTSEENAKTYAQSALKAKNGTAQDLEKVKDSLDHTLESERRVVDVETRVNNVMANASKVEKSVEEAKATLSENTQKSKEIDTMYESIKATAAGKEFRGGTAKADAIAGLVPTITAERCGDVLMATGWRELRAELVRVQDVNGFVHLFPEEMENEDKYYLETYLARMTALISAIERSVTLKNTTWQDEFTFKTWHDTTMEGVAENYIELQKAPKQSKIEISESAVIDGVYHDVCVDSDIFRDMARTDLLGLEEITLHGPLLINMGGLFNGARNVTEINFRGPMVQSSYVDRGSFNSLFFDCENLSRLNGLQYLNDNYVSDFSHMFVGCHQLTNIDLHHFTGRNFRTAERMFFDCQKLMYVDLSNFDIIENVRAIEKDYERKDAVQMFDRCKKLKELKLPKSFKSEYGQELIKDMGIPEEAMANLKIIYV